MTDAKRPLGLLVSIVAVAVMIFLILPQVILLIQVLHRRGLSVFPPKAYGLRWYGFIFRMTPGGRRSAPA